MAERETFTVETRGIGNPDYAQPQEAPALARALAVSYPEREVAAKKYDDFTQINFTATQQVYIIGTNANARIAGIWETGALAREIQFYATAGCWVRFNNPVAVPQYIPATLPLRFYRRVERFYVYQDVGPGILYVWIEG